MTEKAPERIWVEHHGHGGALNEGDGEILLSEPINEKQIPVTEYIRSDIAALAMTPQEAAKVLPDWEGFGRAMLEDWPVRDVDGAELFDLSLKYGLIAEVPGGYDPEHHIDAEGISPETGDPWYEYTFRAISEDNQ
ncbi:hypothetical protein [Sulfitobacter faviae]|uniref:hypothetical protein n=1 Tax=Sulfitobacter faviae TaxID=1775881 RepID=UPI00398D4A4F